MGNECNVEGSGSVWFSQSYSLRSAIFRFRFGSVRTAFGFGSDMHLQFENNSVEYELPMPLIITHINHTNHCYC